MVDSIDVLNGQSYAYTVYASVMIVLMLWFSIKLTSNGKAGVLKDSYFKVLVVILVILGVSLHLATNLTIPWVDTDLNRASITPHQTLDVSVKDHKFTLSTDKLEAKVGDYVLFDVVSEDLTYGFGVFREDNTLVCQMQVVPGSRNDLLWQFAKAGTYYIRSTEYAGPKDYYTSEENGGKPGNRMIIRDAIVITDK